jgi:quercetin dioxygenase-like cupin family protein
MKKLIGGAAFLVGLSALAIAATALATPASGVTSTPIAQGVLDPIKIKAEIGDWESEIETKGQSDLVVVENRVAPGGHFGWHSHPGPSLVIVKSGTSTFYRGDDPTCTGQDHPTGSAYVDPGGVVHTARNESLTEDLVVIVVRLLAPGAQARINAPRPSSCDFG